MAVVYLGVLLIGVGFLSLFGWLASIGEFKVGNAWKPILAVVCAAYSIRQLFRPVPKRVDPDADGAGRDDWRGRSSEPHFDGRDPRA